MYPYNKLAQKINKKLIIKRLMKYTFIVRIQFICSVDYSQHLQTFFFAKNSGFRKFRSYFKFTTILFIILFELSSQIHGNLTVDNSF